MNPHFQKPTNRAAWNREIEAAGLHLKWHKEAGRPSKYQGYSQLERMSASFKKSLSEFHKVIDIEARTIEAEAGDITAQADVEKYWRLDKFSQLADKEIELRGQGQSRKPIGTTYYVDPGSGNDGNAGTSIGTAWATIRKFMEGARSAGDVCIVRRDTTNMSDGTIVTPTADATADNPFILEADYDDVWGDFSSSAQTYTIASGAKSATASATITDISVGDWVYVQGDDARLYCLEVSSVSGASLGFYLPYIGTNFGSGKTLTIMGPNPVNGTTLAGDAIYFNTSEWWIVRGIHSKGGYGNGAWYVVNSRVGLENCISEATSTNANAFGVASYAGLKLFNFRTKGGNNGNSINLGQNNGFVILENVDVDGTKSGANEMLRGIYAQASGMIQTFFKNVHIRNVGNGMGIEFEISAALGTTKCKNITFDNNSAGDVDVSYLSSTGLLTSIVIEDYNGVKGDTRFFSGNGPAETDSPWAQTDTGVSRSGGASASLKIIPSVNMGSPHHMGGYPLIGDQISNSITKGMPIYLSTGTKTITFYFKTENTTDWTANPTASEFYIQAEFLADATNVTNCVKRSTGTVNFTGSTDWQSLSVELPVAQDGLAYIRLIYAKTKEASNSNIFWFDPYIEIS